MEFKNYKEKQAYYKQRSKQEKVFWESSPPETTMNNARKVKKDLVIKGRTYVKPKERKNDSCSD